MGRELQKAKKRSSIAKVRQKPKSKKRIFNNAIIAANWDQRQTLSQNYRRLGLATKLNAPSGGIERNLDDIKKAKIAGEHRQDELAAQGRTEAERTNHDRLAIKNTKTPTELIPSEVHIERDPETGKILRVLDGPAETGASVAKSLDDPLNAWDDASDDSEDDENEFQGFDDHVSNGFIGGKTAETDNPIIRQLEERVAQLQRMPKQKRKQSDREIEWVRSMVEKHGDNYDAMFRDRKLNIMQQSKGDLMRRVRRFLEGPKAK